MMVSMVVASVCGIFMMVAMEEPGWTCKLNIEVGSHVAIGILHERWVGERVGTYS